MCVCVCAHSIPSKDLTLDSHTVGEVLRLYLSDEEVNKEFDRPDILKFLEKESFFSLR